MLENVGGGVAGVAVGEDVLGGGVVADGDAEPAVVGSHHGDGAGEGAVQQQRRVLARELGHHTPGPCRVDCDLSAV